MKFEWDNEKNESNFKKHGIYFEEAIVIFNDSFALEFNDEMKDDRFLRMGFNFHKGVLVVIFSETETHIRVISARKATKTEEKLYAQRIRFQQSEKS